MRDLRHRRPSGETYQLAIVFDTSLCQVTYATSAVSIDSPHVRSPVAGDHGLSGCATTSGARSTSKDPASERQPLRHRERRPERWHVDRWKHGGVHHPEWR